MSPQEISQLRAQIEQQIIAELKPLKEKVNPSYLETRFNWDENEKKALFSVFGVSNLVDLCKSLVSVKVEFSSNGQVFISYDEKALAQKDNTNISQRIKKLLNFLNTGLFEKEEAIRLALLSAVAGESIFFLGPPGTAKSMISSRIHKAFKGDCKYFEYLMNEFSTPDEIFGSIKLKGLDEGIYEKNISGYLPEAQIAFLDEIWKSGPAILNTLLTIINEKKFRNGDKIINSPLQILLAASNELPRENAGLDALYDRFIVRMLVNPVTSESDFFSLVEGKSTELKITKEIENLLLDINEIKSWQNDISNVVLDNKIKNVITQIRKELTLKNQEASRDDKEKFYVSDRRWKKIINLLKTSAYLCGRKSIDLMDCQLITYCIWNTAKQRSEVKSIVENIVKQYGLDCKNSIDDINKVIKDFEKRVDDTFFEWQDTSAVQVKMNDGNMAYKFVSPCKIQFYYDGEKIIHYFRCIKQSNNSKKYSWYLYDSKKELLNVVYGSTSDSDIVSDSVSCTLNDNYRNYSLSAKLEMNPKQLVKKAEIFNNINVFLPVANAANKNYYQPIFNEITKQYQALNNFRKKVEKDFDKHLFADKKFKNTIISKIISSQKELEDANIRLEKQKNRYDKGSF